MDPPIPKLSLRTVTALDVPDIGRHPPQLVRQESFGGGQLVSRSRVPYYLVLESVLEQLCNFYESDDTLRKELFEGVRRRLHQLKFLDPTPDLQELCSLRMKFRKSFSYLIQNVRRDLHGQPNDSLVCLPGPQLDFALFRDDEVICHQKRYKYDFEEIGKIAHGGFGVVCKAMRRTDRQVYAIKKIPFKYCNLRFLKQVLREVELLAQLSHPNIVAYKSAWIENVTDFMVKSRTTTVNSSQSTVLISSETGDVASSLPYVVESSSSLEEEPPGEGRKQLSSGACIETGCGGDSDSDVPEQCASLDESSRVTMQFVSGSVSVEGWKRCRHNSKSDSELRKGGDGHAVNGRKSSSGVTRSRALTAPGEHIFRLLHSSDVGGMLYIQMELCSKNLADWLAARNQQLAALKGSDNKDFIPKAMHIFKQILKGVVYMHSKGFIHRDIKPQNILFDLDGSLVKLGDFGLATRSNQLETLPPQLPWAPRLGHTRGVGTSLYAAPEQYKEASYDTKVDIYSLGVVLTELLCPFTTDHERHAELGKLRSGCLPTALQDCSPDVVSSILAMCHSNPEERPSAKELLISPLFVAKDKIIKDLKAEIQEKDKQMASMATELSALRSEMAKMQAEIRWYQENGGTAFFSHNS